LLILKYYRAVGEEKLSEDIDQLFELTRIIVLVVGGLVPALSENKSQGNSAIF
jgi:HEAT repeat-containing protein 5